MSRIYDRIRPKYKTKNDEIVAELFKAAGADTPAAPELIIKKKTAEVSALMALIHGGDWRVQIDHEVGLVVIARRSRKQSR